MKNKVKILNFVLLVVLVLIFSCGQFSGIVYAQNQDVQFDDSNLLDDLSGATVNGKPFSILNYPFDSTGLVKHPEIMNVVEYCYSYYVNARSNYGLYLYFYNPQALDIDVGSQGNKVQLAVAWETNDDGDVIATKYDKFRLEFCSTIENGSYKHLFYKFKVVDEKGDDGKTIAERVNSNGRRYDISGVELVTVGNYTATEYLVGGTYIFTGYAKGYGPDKESESDLTCAVRNIETVQLDLTGTTDGIDKRTYWRSNSSSLGAHHQNQINSVFFAIDKNVLEKYGYTLQRIKAEWWEYKTRPAIVIDDKDVYDGLSRWNGVEISKDYDSTREWSLNNKDYETISNPYGVSIYYDWSWNVELQSGVNNYIRSRDVDTLLPLLFYTNGIDVNDYVLLPETLQSYIYSYNKSTVNGFVETGSKSLNADLFNQSVDEGRTMGYNLRVFDIGNPDDYWNINSYDETHNWWNKLWDYGFGSIVTDDSFFDVKPIQMVTPDQMAVSDLSSALFINAEDVDEFKRFYNSVKDDCEVFIFRYALTDYWAEDLEISEINQDTWGYTAHNDVGELRQGTQFFDFDILEFTFNKEGVYTVLPVVSSPLDHISGYTPSIEPERLDWSKLLQFVMLVILLLLLLPLLPYVVKFVVFIVKLPFKVVGTIAKWISATVKKRK